MGGEVPDLTPPNWVWFITVTQLTAFGNVLHQTRMRFYTGRDSRFVNSKYDIGLNFLRPTLIRLLPSQTPSVVKLSDRERPKQ